MKRSKQSSNNNGHINANRTNEIDIGDNRTAAIMKPILGMAGMLLGLGRNDSQRDAFSGQYSYSRGNKEDHNINGRWGLGCSIEEFELLRLRLRLHI